MQAKHLTKLQKVLEGKSKAQAKGVTRKGIAGYGRSIIEAQDEQHVAVWKRILECLKQDAATLLLAIQEVEQLRDQRVEACKGERKDKKKASVRVSFARILTILRAYSKGENKEKIIGSTSLPEMYAFASRKGTQRGKGLKVFDETQFSNWTSNVKRIVGTVPNKKATDAERGKFDKQLARIEQHLVNVLQTLQTYEHVTTVPVKAMLSMARKGGKHIRLAKAA